MLILCALHPRVRIPSPALTTVDRETVRPWTFLYPFQVIYGLLLAASLLFAWQRWRGGSLGLGGVMSIAFAIGWTLIFVAYLQNLHKRPLQPDYSRTCYNCRLPVNRFSEFCEHCGVDLVERQRIGACPSCEAEAYQGVAFCPSCGEDLRNKRLKKVRY